MNDRIKISFRHMLRRFRSARGSGDLTVTLLMTAAGAAMVGMTVPTLFKSSDTAAKTFDKQVQILERGANSGSTGSGSSLSGIAGGTTTGLGQGFDIGSGKSISGPTGNVGLRQGNAGLSQGNTGLSQGNTGMTQGNTGMTQGNTGMTQGQAGVVTPVTSPVVTPVGPLKK